LHGAGRGEGGDGNECGAEVDANGAGGRRRSWTTPVMGGASSPAAFAAWSGRPGPPRRHLEQEVEAAAAGGISSRTARSLDGDDGEVSAAQRIHVLDPEEEAWWRGCREIGGPEAGGGRGGGRREEIPMTRKPEAGRPAGQRGSGRSGRVWKGLERGGCVEGGGGGNNEGRKKTKRKK
jgi:hypothetical protein